MKKCSGAIVLFFTSFTAVAQHPVDSIKKWSYHFQLTAISQQHPANGETFRIGSADPKLYAARYYIRQHFALGNSANENAEDEANQLAGVMPASRITITAGKFSLSDFFDDNLYGHDPRSQFLNWSLMSNAAWDYPADRRGYTAGIVAELVQPG